MIQSAKTTICTSRCFSSFIELWIFWVKTWVISKSVRNRLTLSPSRLPFEILTCRSRGSSADIQVWDSGAVPPVAARAAWFNKTTCAERETPGILIGCHTFRRAPNSAVLRRHNSFQFQGGALPSREKSQFIINTMWISGCENEAV